MPNRFEKDRPIGFIPSLTSCGKALNIPLSYYPADGRIFPNSHKTVNNSHCEQVLCIKPEYPQTMFLVAFQPSQKNKLVGALTQKAWVLMAHEAVTERDFPAGFVFIQHADRAADNFKPYVTLERVIEKHFKTDALSNQNFTFLIEPDDETTVEKVLETRLDHGNFASILPTSSIHAKKAPEGEKLTKNIALFSNIIQAGTKESIKPAKRLVLSCTTLTLRS